MSDFDINEIQDLDQVAITDLDAQVGNRNSSLSIRLLGVVRALPCNREPRGGFILLMYCMCVVVLLFMIQPGLPVMTEQFATTPTHELHYPIAIYPFTVKGTSPAQSVTWIRTSNGQMIGIQTIPGKIVWHQCKIQHSFAPSKYAHPMIITCT